MSKTVNFISIYGTGEKIPVLVHIAIAIFLHASGSRTGSISARFGFGFLPSSKARSLSSSGYVTLISLDDDSLMYPAGSGISKVSTKSFSQEVVSLTNKVRYHGIDGIDGRSELDELVSFF